MKLRIQETAPCFNICKLPTLNNINMVTEEITLTVISLAIPDGCNAGNSERMHIHEH